MLACAPSHSDSLGEALALANAAPARTDPAAAPPAQDTLYVLVPVGHLDPRSEQDWDALIESSRSIMDQLTDSGVVVDVDERRRARTIAQERGVVRDRRDSREHQLYWPNRLLRRSRCDRQ